MAFEIFFGVGMFTVTVLVLVLVILFARSKLVSTGKITIDVNDDPEKRIETTGGPQAARRARRTGRVPVLGLRRRRHLRPVQVRGARGGGDALPTEAEKLSRREIREGWRLSCQVAVKQDMKIEVPEEFFGVKKLECTVVSNDNVATFIKELVLKLPEGVDVDFRAGGFMQIEVPKFHAKFSDFDIPEEYRGTGTTSRCSTSS